MNRRRLLITLSLQPLEAEESQRLTTHLLRGQISPEVTGLLHRQGEGNPFFLEELLRALVEEGTLVLQEGSWQLRSDPGALLPPRAVEAIQMRLARLEPTVVELLRIAAVMGRACEPTLLAQIMQIDVEQVESILLVAAGARLMRPDAHGNYAFTHDMVRETLYSEVGSARRRRLHQAIGEALEAQGDADLQTLNTRQLADLAFHFAEAGAKARGVTYILAAGERALRASADVDALTHFHTAVRLLSPDGDPAQRAAALMGLGDAAILTGDYVQAVEAYQASQEAWLRNDDGVTAATVWYRLGKVRWRQELVAGAREAFDRALALLGPEDRPEAAETLLQLADLHATSLGRNAESVIYAERALAMVQRLGNRHLEATAYCVVGNVKARSNDLAAGRASLERGLALAQELNDPALGAEACAYLANIYAWTADLDRSRRGFSPACGACTAYSRRISTPACLFLDREFGDIAGEMERSRAMVCGTGADCRRSTQSGTARHLACLSRRPALLSGTFWRGRAGVSCSGRYSASDGVGYTRLVFGWVGAGSGRVGKARGGIGRLDTATCARS